MEEVVKVSLANFIVIALTKIQEDVTEFVSYSTISQVCGMMLYNKEYVLRGRSQNTTPDRIARNIAGAILYARENGTPIAIERINEWKKIGFRIATAEDSKRMIVDSEIRLKMLDGNQRTGRANLTQSIAAEILPKGFEIGAPIIDNPLGDVEKVLQDAFPSKVKQLD